MQTRNLYKYETADGYAVSPNNPGSAYTGMYRMIADEGKALTKDGGLNCAGVVDIPEADLALWREIDAPTEDDNEQSDMIAALRAEVSALRADLGTITAERDALKVKGGR